MKLSNLPNEKKLELCKWYFKFGFACLPFLWCVNAIWFFNEAFKRDHYDEQRDIKKFVILSAAGGLLWIIGLTTWIVIFQTNRAAWGEFGDQMSILIPTGRA